ncbi:hypothetical protein ACFLQ0_01530 [Nitrospinota bacterium]
MLRDEGALLAAVGLLMVLGAGGCAYEIHQEGQVVNPKRLFRIQTVVVMPFRYLHDWTGYFREIYRSAGLEPPQVEKIDDVEATFLPEGALLKRGYTVRSWPSKMKKFSWSEGITGAKFKEALSAIQASGAEAVLFLRGRSVCLRIHHCVAAVDIKMVDAENGTLIWKSKATGSTFISHGNEMRAAIEEALDALPSPPVRP